MKTKTEYWRYNEDFIKVYIEEETPDKDIMTFNKVIQQNKKSKEFVDIWDMVDPKQK